MLEHDLKTIEPWGFPQEPVHQLGRNILYKDAASFVDSSSHSGRFELHSNSTGHLFNLQGSDHILI